MYTCILDSHTYNLCGITTCKWNSIKCNGRCMLNHGLDSKVLTIHELAYYKSNGLTPKQVEKLKLRAISNIRKLIIFYKYIQWISDNNEPCNIDIDLTDVCKRYPFNVEIIGFKPWMFRFISKESYKKFNALGENYDLEDILYLSTLKLNKLLGAINENSNFKRRSS